MSIHFNAFISYRHHPDDMKVAAEIHRRLERFHVPRAIKKQGKRITRLFRDKEELPITSSLTDNITMALENSDFLIVICSPHLKESVWCQREIETFLKTHTHDQVLTVLASGEPQDVIPEILQYQEVVNPDTGEIERQDVEALSCDWRVGHRKAIREELPRLAAALLGCSYDELRQRQRQYRTRRLIAGFSLALAASLALAGYYLYTSIQIQNSLNQSLRNQSQYLASSSGKALEDGDRLTALALALAGLPGDGGERPYLPEVEMSLSDALYSYQASTTTAAVATFDAGSQIQDFLTNEDGSLLIILDERGLVTTWDTNTFQRLHGFDPGVNLVRSIHLTRESNILLRTQAADLTNSLLCFDQAGTLLWSWENIFDFAFLDDGATLLLLYYNFEAPYQLLSVDPVTGCESAPMLELSNTGGLWGTEVTGFFQREYDSAKPITLDCHTNFNDAIFLADLQEGSFQGLVQLADSDTHSYFFNDVHVGTDGSILALISDGSGIMNGNYGAFEVTSLASADLVCYDSQTLQEKWRSEIDTYVYSGQYVVEPVPETDLILCQSGNVFQLHDAATGQITLSCQTSDIPITVQVEQSQTWGILRNGSTYSVDHSDGQCNAVPVINNSIDGAAINHGLFFHTPLSTRVTLYRSIQDDNGDLLTPMDLYSTCRLFQGDHLVLSSFKDLVLVDVARDSLLWQQTLDISAPQLLGFSGDQGILWLWEQHKHRVLGLDSATGAPAREHLLQHTIDDLTVVDYDSNVLFQDEQLYYILKAEGVTQLHRFDLTTGTQLPALELPELARDTLDFSNTLYILARAGDHLWLWQDSDRILTLHLTTGEIQQISTGVSTRPVITVHPDPEQDQVLVSAGSDALLCGSDGTILQTISLGDQKAVSFHFHREDLLILADDGVLYRYSAAGDLQSRTPLNLYESYYYNVTRPCEDPLNLGWYETDDGDLILGAYNAGNIIDTTHWQIRAFVPNFTLYDGVRNRILCQANNELHAFPLYSTQDQITRARQVLGDFQLTDAQLKFYGIG